MNTDPVKNKIFEIESAISAVLENNQLRNGNLMGAKAGAVLFYYYLHRYTGREEYGNKSLQLLEQTLEDYKFDAKSYSFCSGLAGLVWLLNFLEKEGFINEEACDALSDTEEFLYKKMLYLFDSQKFDFLHHGMGLFFVFINNRFLKKYALDDIIREVIKRFKAYSVPEGNGCKWHDLDLLTEFPRTNIFNFGLAHGIPAFISILAIASGKTVNTELRHEVITLAESAARYILSKKGNGEGLSLFPYSVSGEEEIVYESRLAWCYGDPGIACAFRHLYESTGLDLWKTVSHEIITHAAKRQSLQANKITDACLCHGSAGVAQVFRRFHEKTENTELKNIAGYWNDITLKFGKSGAGFAGYQFYRGEDGFMGIFGFLEGIIGVGLSLMANESNDCQNWDQALLIS